MNMSTSMRLCRISLPRAFVFVLLAIAGAAPAGEIDPCKFPVQPLHQAPEPILLLAAGEIDASHAGLELLAVQANGVILRLDHGAAGWNVQPLGVTVEPPQSMSWRPTINIGDVHPGFAGNEIVIETYNNVWVLVQPSPGQWQHQIVFDSAGLLDSTWGVRIGDIDPAQPGQEVFFITEGIFDFSAGRYATPAGGTWQSQFVYDGEVGMDSAIGDVNPTLPGNEIVVGTEMGPVYEIASQPGNPRQWPRRTLWDDYENAPWTLRIADILPDAPGNEIAYGSRYSDRLLLSRVSGAAHAMEIVFTGDATQPMTMWDIAVGNVVPASESMEIVGVDDLGMAYIAEHDGEAWSGQPLWQDAGGALYASVIADFLPASPGPEIIVAGASGAITLIRHREPVMGDITCDGVVNINDLLDVINTWGPCAAPCPPSCAADIEPPTGDCQVNINDLLTVLNNWN